MKRKYIFEVETLPQHAICPPMRRFKPIEGVGFVYFNEEMALLSILALFIDIVNMNVIGVTLVIHKVNMFSKNSLLQQNLKELKMSYR